MNRLRWMGLIVVLMAIPLMAQGRPGGGTPGGNRGGGPKYRVLVRPDSVLMRIGEVRSFEAYLVDAQGSRKDTTFSWSLSGPEIGSLTPDGAFTASERGRTHVVATVGRFSGKALVIVQGDSTQRNPQKKNLRIQIEPPSVVLFVGDTLTFVATCYAPGRRPVDTTLVWSAEGDHVAVSEEGVVEALSVGRGWVYATVGDLSGRALVIVRERPKPETPVRHGFYHLRIAPSDTVIRPGSEVRFRAFLVDTAGTPHDTVVTWILRASGVGTLDEEGTFRAERPGLGLIQARVGTRSAVARVMVRDDGIPCDTARIRIRDREGNQYGRTHRIAESDVLRISGLPFPFSLLNGGELILPPGSLDQGITIQISLPDLAEIRDDTTLVFPEGILNGIRFDVYVDSVKVSPYGFETPVLVVLPYKQDLMAELGITLENLALLFYREDGSYEEDGVVTFIVDTTHNKVYAEVTHFSQLVLGDRSRLIVTHVASDPKTRPLTFSLYPSYPNPFNPHARIEFGVSGKGEERVRLVIYDLGGRLIRVLFDSPVSAGNYGVTWDGRDSEGLPVPSGIYLCRLEGKAARLTRRLVLLK